MASLKLSLFLILVGIYCTTVTAIPTAYVDPSGTNVAPCNSTNPCSTIGFALLNAGFDLTTVVLNPGTYAGRDQCALSFNKVLTITSAAGKGVTTVNCSQTAGWTFSTSTFTITGLTFIKAGTSALTFNSITAGTVYDCAFYLNKRAITINDSPLTVASSRFDSSQDGSICQFISSGSPSLIISDSVFRDGVAGSTCAAGGVFTDLGTLIITNSFFMRNDIAVRKSTSTSGSITLTGNSFNSNGKSTSPTAAAISKASIVCPLGTSVTYTSNLYCGLGGMVTSCGGAVTTQPQTYADGCGVCSGTNSRKDCTGTCFGLATSCSSPNSIWVATNGSDSNNGTQAFPYLTIQKAIDMASYGDTVYVMDGNYPVSTSISMKGKGIRLRSQWLEADRVIISCTAIIYGFKLDDGYRESWDTIIEGMTVRNCSVGLVATIESSPTVKNVIFSGNGMGSSAGGGMRLLNSYARVDGCVFSDNICDNAAGVMISQAADSESLVHAPFVTIANSRFYRNRLTGGTTGNAGALWVDILSRVTLTNNHFFENQNAIYLRSLNAGRQVVITMTGHTYFNHTSGNVIECAAPPGNSAPVWTKSDNSFCGNPLISGNYGIGSSCNFGSANSTSTTDTCQVCYGSGNTDCSGSCFTSRTDDGSGGCCFQREKDCAGICNGAHYIDAMGACVL